MGSPVTESPLSRFGCSWIGVKPQLALEEEEEEEKKKKKKKLSRVISVRIRQGMSGSFNRKPASKTPGIGTMYHKPILHGGLK